MCCIGKPSCLVLHLSLVHINGISMFSTILMYVEKIFSSVNYFHTYGSCSNNILCNGLHSINIVESNCF